jgi:hypothetical protein
MLGKVFWCTVHWKLVLLFWLSLYSRPTPIIRKQYTVLKAPEAFKLGKVLLLLEQRKYRFRDVTCAQFVKYTVLLQLHFTDCFCRNSYQHLWSSYNSGLLGPSYFINFKNHPQVLTGAMCVPLVWKLCQLQAFVLTRQPPPSIELNSESSKEL